MTEELSRVVSAIETIAVAINGSEDFDGVPVFYDTIEVMPDNMPDTCVVFKAKAWDNADDRCNLERQLDICILYNTDYERDIILSLSKYGEDLKELIDELVLTTNLDLTFLQGSEIYAKRNNREDTESYKGSKTLFSSMIVLSYSLRY